MSEKKLEIYSLAKNIDNVKIEQEKEEIIKITVNLQQPEEEERKLSEKGLISPIKEIEKFRAIKNMKYSQEMLLSAENEKEKKEFLEYISKGEKAIVELMKIFENSAFTFGKNWIHNDNLNQICDWNSIIHEALYKAIMTYDLSYGTQFNTFLRTKVLELCKEEKCRSSLMNVNPTAMAKWRTIQRLKSEIVSKGEDPNDIYLLAKKMGRDISKPNKLKNFKKMLMDMENINPKVISTDAVLEDNKSFGDSITKDELSPLELAEVEKLKKEIFDYCSNLDENAKNTLKYIVGILKRKPLTFDKDKKKFATPEFYRILTESKKFSEYNINFYEFL